VLAECEARRLQKERDREDAIQQRIRRHHQTNVATATTTAAAAATPTYSSTITVACSAGSTTHAVVTSLTGVAQPVTVQSSPVVSPAKVLTPKHTAGLTGTISLSAAYFIYSSLEKT